jgi:hypothetical protein
MSKNGNARLTDLGDFLSQGASGGIKRPRRAPSAPRLRNGRRILPLRLGKLLQSLRIFGQFIGDALKSRIVITRPDRLLRFARQSFDGRSLLLRARSHLRGYRRLLRSDPWRLRPSQRRDNFQKHGTK